MSESSANSERYNRQIVFPGLGAQGQRNLSRSRTLIVGVGGLGSWMAELLARAGAGMLRLADDDHVHITNIHRQALYTEADATAGLAKVDAAAARLWAINRHVDIQPLAVRANPQTIAGLAQGVDLILDGTDNFASRFLINDYAVKTATPWIFAGVVGCEAQTQTIVPGHSPCLRCVLESPPPPCTDTSCRQAGVIGPAVAAIAAMACAEAMKILSGNVALASPYLTKLDLWTNTLQRIDVRQAATNADCPCCKGRIFEYLEP
jgi:adenylyltransferase/sulfurtransferase